MHHATTRATPDERQGDRARATLADAWTSVGNSERLLVVGCASIALASALWVLVPIGAAVGVALLAPAALVDLHVRRLPDQLVVVAIVGAIIATVGGSALTGDATVSVMPDIGHVAAGAAAAGAPLLIVHLASPVGMGFGDVKYGAVLGACLGMVRWELALAALVLASGFGLTASILARARSVAFGAALLAGASVALAAAPVVLRHWTTTGG